MPSDGKEFDDSRAMLGQAIGLLVGAFSSRLPEAGIENPKGIRITGTAGDEPLRGIASRIYDVMEAFDRLQVVIGLPAGEGPRFARFFQDERPAASDATPSPN